jgi:hypothetical protein
LEGKEYTYDGNPHALTKPAKTNAKSGNDTIKYSFDPAADDAEWKTDLSELTKTNAGTYTVWYYVQGDVNHFDTEKASVEVTIGKATAKEGVTRPRDNAMKPLLNCEKVVRGCIKASDRGRTMYVTNWYTKMQHLLFKVVPDPILTRIWLGMIDKK